MENHYPRGNASRVLCGSMLGTVVFNIYVNGHKTITALVLKCADGTKICGIASYKDRSTLQKHLHCMAGWIHFNIVYFIAQCEVIHLRTKNVCHI